MLRIQNKITSYDKLSIFFFVLIIAAGCGHGAYKAPKTDFEFDGCEATFKGKPLPFDGSLNDWVNLLGKYNRSIDSYYYVWDSLGIFLVKTNFRDKYNSLTEKESPDELHISFVNLQSPLGQASDLDLAPHYESYEHVIKRNEEMGYVYNEEEKRGLKKIIDEDSVSKYPYPYNVYQSPVLVYGGIIKKAMTLGEVNECQAQSGTHCKFGCWDLDWDGKNESGSTSVQTGVFANINADNKKQKCAVERNYYLLTTLQITKGVIEYIKIQKVEKGKSIHWSD